VYTQKRTKQSFATAHLFVSSSVHTRSHLIMGSTMLNYLNFAI
jgi:hypothetical protein